MGYKTSLTLRGQFKAGTAAEFLRISEHDQSGAAGTGILFCLAAKNFSPLCILKRVTRILSVRLLTFFCDEPNGHFSRRAGRVFRGILR